VSNVFGLSIHVAVQNSSPNPLKIIFKNNEN